MRASAVSSSFLFPIHRRLKDKTKKHEFGMKSLSVYTLETSPLHVLSQKGMIEIHLLPLFFFDDTSTDSVSRQGEDTAVNLHSFRSRSSPGSVTYDLAPL